MPRKKKPPISPLQAIAKLKAAGLKPDLQSKQPKADPDSLPSLNDRIDILLNIVKNKHLIKMAIAMTIIILKNMINIRLMTTLTKAKMINMIIY